MVTLLRVVKASPRMHVLIPLTHCPPPPPAVQTPSQWATFAGIDQDGSQCVLPLLILTQRGVLEKSEWYPPLQPPVRQNWQA